MWYIDGGVNKVFILMIELNSDIKHSGQEMDLAQMSKVIIGFCDKHYFFLSPGQWPMQVIDIEQEKQTSWVSF